MTAIRSAVRDLVKRARAYARVSHRTLGGVSKLIFDDTRTLETLASGRLNVRMDRVERGERRLAELENGTGRDRAGQRRGSSRGKKATT